MPHGEFIKLDRGGTQHSVSRNLLHLDSYGVAFSVKYIDQERIDLLGDRLRTAGHTASTEED